MGFRGIGSNPLLGRGSGTSPPLTHAQRMWLLYGFDERWRDAFRDEAAYRDAWARHRDELLRECGPCRRPIAWWVIESGHKYPGFDNEREREELIRSWQEAFARGWRSDVPSELWAEWESQRRDETAAEHPAA